MKAIQVKQTGGPEAAIAGELHRHKR